MESMHRLVILLLLVPALALAQFGRDQPLHVTADPAGACIAADRMRLNTTTGALWACKALTWTNIAGGGGGGSATPGGSSGQLQYNNAGTFGGMSGAVWTNSVRDLNFLSADEDPLVAISANPVGDASSAAILSANAGGARPSQISSTPATKGGDVFLRAMFGGRTSIATTGTGGEGGAADLRGGDGGNALSATTASTGGNAGAVNIRGGVGGSAPVSGAGTNVGGVGGNVVVTVGNGGAATSGGSNTGGNGGHLIANLASGGAGATAVGLDGTFKILRGTRVNADILSVLNVDGTTVIAKINKSGNLISGTGSTAPTVSGCTSAAIVAGSTALAGQINTTPTGACAVTLTFGTAASHGYNCGPLIANQTQGNIANALFLTAQTTTTAVYTGTTVAGDVLAYGPCVGW